MSVYIVAGTELQGAARNVYSALSHKNRYSKCLGYCCLSASVRTCKYKYSSDIVIKVKVICYDFEFLTRNYLYCKLQIVNIPCPYTSFLYRKYLSLAKRESLCLYFFYKLRPSYIEYYFGNKRYKGIAADINVFSEYVLYVSCGVSS